MKREHLLDEAQGCYLRGGRERRAVAWALLLEWARRARPAPSTRQAGFADLVVLAIVAAAIVGVLAGARWWLHADRARQFKAGQAETQQRWNADTTARLAAALEDARLSAAESLRRLNKQQENQRAQDKLLAKVRSDAAGAIAAVDGLRLRAASYLSAAGCSAAAGDAALECVRQAAAQIGDVLGHCAARHQQLAADADDARARGLKCEADYDALTLVGTKP